MSAREGRRMGTRAAASCSIAPGTPTPPAAAQEDFSDIRPKSVLTLMPLVTGQGMASD